jgi:hypothetical protein
MKSSLSLGPIAGFGHLMMLVIDMIMLVYWEWICPLEDIDIALDFDYDNYTKDRTAFGDHTFNVDSKKQVNENE